jgi:hypothetical protein
MNDSVRVSGPGTTINNDLFSSLNVAGELGADPQVVDQGADDDWLATIMIYIVIGGLGSLASPPVSEDSLAEVGPNAGLDELLQTRQKANRT